MNYVRIGTCVENGPCAFHCLPAVSPPSTTIACPVTNVDSSLASHSAHCAISVASPARRIGWNIFRPARAMSAACSTFGMPCVINGVTMPVSLETTGQLRLFGSSALRMTYRYEQINERIVADDAAE